MLKGINTSVFFFISEYDKSRWGATKISKLSFCKRFGSRERSPLPNNSLVENTPSPKINREVRLKTMEYQLDQNFTARVPDKLRES